MILVPGHSLKFARTLVAAAFAFALAGCGPLIDLPNSGPAPALYNLTVPPSISATGTAYRVMLEDPTAASGLAVTYIARRPAATELQYYADARWTDRPTNMMQALLAETLEAAGQPVTTGRGGSPLPIDYELQMEIRDFQADYAGTAAPEVRIRLSLKLVKMGPPQVVGQHVVDVRRQASGTTIDAVIAAFDVAGREALSKAATWTINGLE